MRRLSFTRVGLTYGLTRTNIKTFNDASSLLFQQLQFRSIAGPSALDGIVSSTLTPSITYNTVNNPVNPTGGKSYMYQFSLTGGPLGGNVNTITNVFDFKRYKQVNKKRNVLGFHASAAYISGFGGLEIPPYSRFYMGGEQDIRGYDIRSISPVTFIPTTTFQQLQFLDPTTLNAQGSPITRTISVPILTYSISLPGGDLQTYGNFEYRIPIVGPVTAALFVDGGTNGSVQTSALHITSQGLNSLTQQFPTATLPVSQGGAGLTPNLAISPGTNFRFRGSTGIEFVVQLPIIQAPFRIYYAYNINRLHSQLIAPTDFIEPSEISEQLGQNGQPIGLLPRTLPSEVWNLQVKPTLNQFLLNPGRLNYFEPLTTFRFTVSRTF